MQHDLCHSTSVTDRESCSSTTQSLTFIAHTKIQLAHFYFKYKYNNNNKYKYTGSISFAHVKRKLCKNIQYSEPTNTDPKGLV